MTERHPLRRLAAPGLLLLAALAIAPRPAAAGDNVMVSGSVFVDYWQIEDRPTARRAPRSVSPEGSLKVQVDIHDDLSFSAKACFSCHGIDMEHAFLEYTPKIWFNVQAGRIAVPFGEFSNRIDPSGHKTTSFPLIYDMGRAAYLEKSAMNFGVVMLPYVDTGVMVYGVKWLGKLQAWYGAYAVAGMRGTNDLDFMAQRTAYYNDNNSEPAGGGRLALTWASEADAFLADVQVGGSFTAGRYDREAELAYAAAAADASFKLGPFTFRGEYALRRTELDPDASYRYAVVDAYANKEGWYAELEHPLGNRLALVYRYDELRRRGVPLPGAIATMTPDSKFVRYTAGFVFTPAQATFVKAGWELWDTTDFADFHSWHVGFGGAF
jgi:hypothetical protein